MLEFDAIAETHYVNSTDNATVLLLSALPRWIIWCVCNCCMPLFYVYSVQLLSVIQITKQLSQ